MYAQTAREGQETQQSEYVAAQKKELEQAFGDNYNDSIAAAQRFAQTLDVDLNDPDIGNNAKLIKAFAKGASLVSQDKLVPPASVQTAQSVQAQARDIMLNPENAEHALYKGKVGTYADQEAVRKKVRAMLGGHQ